MDVEQLYESEVFDEADHRVGNVGQVYLDDATGEPSWITVKTGLFGTKENFIPLGQAEITEKKIRVPFSREFIKAAPGVEPDAHLDADEQEQLFNYYQVSRSGAPNQ